LALVAERKTDLKAKAAVATDVFRKEFYESPNIEKRILGRLFCKVECHEALRYIKFADMVSGILIVTLPRLVLC